MIYKELLCPPGGIEFQHGIFGDIDDDTMRCTTPVVTNIFLADRAIHDEATAKFFANNNFSFLGNSTRGILRFLNALPPTVLSRTHYVGLDDQDTPRLDTRTSDLFEFAGRRMNVKVLTVNMWCLASSVELWCSEPHGVQLLSQLSERKAPLRKLELR